MADLIAACQLEHEVEAVATCNSDASSMLSKSTHPAQLGCSHGALKCSLKRDLYPPLSDHGAQARIASFSKHGSIRGLASVPVDALWYIRVPP